MSIEDVTSKIRERMGDNSGLDSILKFDLGDDGAIVLDGKNTPNSVNNDASVEADCTVGVALEDLKGMISGDLDPMAAFSLGKLRIEGDMGVAMKLGSLLQ